MEKRGGGLLLILLTVLTPVLIAPRPVHAVYPTYIITANPSSVSIQAGTSGTTQVSVTSNGGSSGTADLVATVSPYPQLNVTLNPSSVTVPPGGTATTTANISTNSTATPAQYFVEIGTILAQGGFNVTVTPGPVTVPDFRLNANVTSSSAPVGGVVHFALNVTSLGGFSGDVDLSLNPRYGLVNPSIVHLAAGAVANATFTVAELCPAYVESFQTVGTSSSRLHWLVMNLTPLILGPGFCFRSDSALRMVIGSSQTTNLILYSENGFAGNVVLTASSDIATSFYPTNNLNVTLGGPGIQRLQVTGMIVTVPPDKTPGNYSIMVTGVSGSHSYVENETVEAIAGPYFTIRANTTSVTLHKGSIGFLRVSLSSERGFNGLVDLYTVASINGFNFSAYPAGDLYLQSGYTTFVNVAFNVTTGTPLGTYELLLEATTHYLPTVNAILVIPITVDNTPTSPPSGSGSTGSNDSNILGLPPIVFYSGVAVAVMVVTLTGAIFLRSKKSRSSGKLAIAGNPKVTS